MKLISRLAIVAGFAFLFDRIGAVSAALGRLEAEVDQLDQAIIDRTTWQPMDAETLVALGLRDRQP